MAEAKTKKTTVKPEAFLLSVKDDATRRDCVTLVNLMERLTGEPAAMWGPSIVGFGSYHYVYASGAEGDWPLVGFSPRARSLSIYIMSGFADHAALLKQLGKHKSAKACLYVKSLADVDLAVLERLVDASIQYVRQTRSPRARTTAKAAAGKATRKKAAKPARRQR